MKIRARTAVAILAFLLAGEIALGVAGHFYFEANYPIDSSKIKRSLDTPVIQELFKVADARKAGYEDEQIASFLARQNVSTRAELTNRFSLIAASVWVVAGLVLVGLVLLSNQSASPSNDA